MHRVWSGARSWWAVLASAAIVVTACSGGGATPAPQPPASAVPTPTAAATATPTAAPTASPTAAATASPSPSASPTASPSEPPSATPSASASASASGGTGLLVPTIDLSTVGGPGEGELNLIIWAGYAEDGSNLPKYDWVHPFTEATGCTVNSKVGNTSDEMVSLMRQGGGTLYDGLSASGDASNRLIANGDLAEIDPAEIPGFNDLAEFMQSPPHNTVDGKHYGVSHGWGGNLLMFNKDKVSPAPTSWDVVFDPAKAAANTGLITAYDSPIYIADAALYLKAKRPELKITDPYELTREQFDAAVALLKEQRPHVGKYWSLYTDEIDNFKSGASTLGTSWPYQLNTLKGEGIPVEAIVPAEGMTGWADTWMMSSKAKHPNCMKKWMAWMITPEVQAQVAEYFGEAPANPKACQYLDVGYADYANPGFCAAYSVNEPTFYSVIAFWKTPLASCGDDRGETCIDYSEWTTKWTEIKG